MKRLINGFFMCQSMFCAFPIPCKVWDEKARDIMLHWLPVIGLEIGLCWFGIGWLCRYLMLPKWITGMVLALFPYFATGLIHLDGFMDVTDAVKSYRSLERRREILKDSHVGSFAVIGCCMLLIAQFAFCASISESADLRILIFIPAVSRCGSILAVFMLPKMDSSQYNQTKAGKAIAVPVLLLMLFMIAGFVFCGKYGFCLIGVCIGYVLPLQRAYRSLQGMNGDVSGYSQTISELAAIAVLALL